MKAQTLIAFALATLVVALFAWALQREPGPGAPGQAALPGLAPQLNQVTALVIEPAGSASFRLELTAEGWRAPAKGGYPVNTAKVRRFLLRLADAQVLETKTANPALHDRLGVDAPDDRPGSGVLLHLEGTDAVPPVLIGQRETRGLGGTYLRLIDEPAALLVDQDLQLEREPLDWLERELLDIPPEDIESLEIVQPDGDTLRIDRDELGIFRIAEPPAGFRPPGPTAAEAVARALAGLRLDDVRPLEGWEPEDPPTRARFRLRDGLVIEARSWVPESDAADTASWTAFAASHEPTEDGAAPAQEVIDRAGGLNSRLGPWLFSLPAWKHEQLTRRSTDLLIPAGD